MENQSFSYFEVTQNTKRILVTVLPAGIVVNISYAAIRGQSDEPGAVQRILNPSRISSIKQFTLKVGDFPGAIILNWVNKENPIQRSDNKLSFKLVGRSAQIIDGQHRLAGIRAAIEEDEKINALQLPVAIYENLTTRECADIFLSINTEQKTAPRSLVFDLYGLASEPTIDAAALRARDIAIFLNEEESSPYRDLIKLPGAPRRKGGIALSTAVTALKDLVEDRGNLEQIGATELELQRRIILNYFSVLAEKYGDEGKLLEAYYSPIGCSMVILDYKDAEDWIKDQASVPILSYYHQEAYPLADMETSVKSVIESLKAAESIMASK